MKSFILILTILGCMTACDKSPVKPQSSPAIEKSNTCACSASGVWNSCSVTCPIKNGICLANCTTASVWGTWAFGSVATCTCGTGTVGRFVAGPEIYFDEVNVHNLEALKVLIAGNTAPTIVQLRSSLEALLSVVNDEDGKIRAEKFNGFFNAMDNLPEAEARALEPDIKQIAAACGR